MEVSDQPSDDGDTPATDAADAAGAASDATPEAEAKSIKCDE